MYTSSSKIGTLLFRSSIFLIISRERSFSTAHLITSLLPFDELQREQQNTDTIASYVDDTNNQIVIGKTTSLSLGTLDTTLDYVVMWRKAFDINENSINDIRHIEIGPEDSVLYYRFFHPVISFVSGNAQNFNTIEGNSYSYRVNFSQTE